jgi:Family of unknown function (DUF6111)
MVRPFFYEIVLFLLPFLGYALWLFWRSVNPITRAAWQNAPFLRLLLAALVTTGVGLALVGHYQSAPAGSAYVPAHLENGKFVEPQMK